MKIIYLILVAIIFSCHSAKEEKPQERTIIGAPDIEVNTSTGKTTVVTHYSDSTIAVVNLNAAGELLDSTTHYPTKK